MLKVRFNLSKVVAIATCFAVTTMFSGCDDEKENAKVPVLTTAEASAISATGAVSGGNVISDGGAEVTERGVYWGTLSSDLTVSGSKTADGKGTGSFTSTLAGLTANTTYYVCAYATNSAGTAYGNVVSFSTAAVAPVLTTAAVTAITATTATAGGNITIAGTPSYTDRGVCYATTANPVINGSKVTATGSGTGDFTAELTNLTAETQYYVRAYATNDNGTVYGNEVTFTTAAVSEKVKLVKTMYEPRSMHTYQFEYDNQNRIREITILNSKTKYTLTYSGENLTKVNYEGVDRYSHVDDHGEVTYEDVEFNKELVYVRNGNTITGPAIEYDYNTYTISLNNDELPAKIVFDEGFGPSEYTFKYQSGNVNEITSVDTGKDALEKITKYDNKKSPFYHCKTPKWFYWVFFEYCHFWEFFCQNNPIELTGTFTYDGYKYDSTSKYVYDSDGYVTARYSEYDDYDDQEDFTFTYK